MIAIAVGYFRPPSGQSLECHICQTLGINYCRAYECVERVRKGTYVTLRANWMRYCCLCSLSFCSST